MTPPAFVRSLLGSVALGVPFWLAAHLAAALVTPLTNTTVGALVRVTAPLTVVTTADTEAEAAAPPNDEPVALALGAATKPTARRGFKAAASPASLFVSKATVLKLAQTAARPHGSFVQQTPEHPAGLRLSGVAPLGIGVQDGDILIEALGITPRSPGQVIGAVIEARAKQARFLSGTIWRHGQTIRLTVEQPYAPERS